MKLLVPLLVLLGINFVNSLDEATVADIRAQIRQFIIDEPLENNRNNNDLRFLGGLVRLAFHDCVGDRCDGCINTNHPDNAGLDIYINGIEELYSNLQVNDQSVSMSRADFWALAGIEAVYYSSQRANSNHLPNITFYTGRIDCATSPSTSELHDFPSALGDTAHILEFFRTQFGFDEKEATAIMGAHTLGSAHPEASGFVHPWVPRKDVLDNAFYTDLRESSKGWNQRSIGPPDNRQYFWESTGDTRQLMLNADMALIRNLSSKTATGMVSCSYNTCPVANTDTVTWVDTFSTNNDFWIDEFSKAFQKMIEKGWEGQLQVVGTNYNGNISSTAATGPDATEPTTTDNVASSNVSLGLFTVLCVAILVLLCSWF